LYVEISKSENGSLGTIVICCDACGFSEISFPSRDAFKVEFPLFVNLKVEFVVVKMKPGFIERIFVTDVSPSVIG